MNVPAACSTLITMIYVSGADRALENGDRKEAFRQIAFAVIFALCAEVLR